MDNRESISYQRRIWGDSTPVSSSDFNVVCYLLDTEENWKCIPVVSTSAGLEYPGNHGFWDPEHAMRTAITGLVGANVDHPGLPGKHPGDLLPAALKALGQLVDCIKGFHGHQYTHVLLYNQGNELI
jgi:hypothetical protein